MKRGLSLFFLVAAVGAAVFFLVRSGSRRGFEKSLSTTLVGLERAGTAVEIYTVDWGFSPKVHDVDVQAALLKEAYGREIPLQDGWGGRLLYQQGPGGREYTLLSFGPDRKRETPDDIRFQNGLLIVNPTAHEGYDRITP